MRIFDRIASGAIVANVDWEPMSGQQLAALRKVVHEYPRIVVDEAAEYLAMHQNDSWEPNDEFGVMRPPFEAVWVEWITPSKRLVENELRDWGKTQYACMLMPSFDSDDQFIGTAFIAIPETELIIQLPITPRINADWSVDFGVVRRSLANWMELQPGVKTEDQAWSNFGFDLLPLWLGIAWSNCLTFELQDDGPNDKLRKKRERKGFFPGLEYKRIVIGKKQRKRWESQTGKSSQKFHLVRGHFADYRERGLFGKQDMRGVFWIPGHARGDKALGVINKEYHVSAEVAQ